MNTLRLYREKYFLTTLLRIVERQTIISQITLSQLNYRTWSPLNPSQLREGLHKTQRLCEPGHPQARGDLWITKEPKLAIRVYLLSFKTILQWQGQSTRPFALFEAKGERELREVNKHVISFLLLCHSTMKKSLACKKQDSVTQGHTFNAAKRMRYRQAWV